MRVTKKQVLRDFRELFADKLKSLKSDVVAKRELWHIYTDGLCKDQVITDQQYSNWTNPF